MSLSRFIFVRNGKRFFVLSPRSDHTHRNVNTLHKTTRPSFCKYMCHSSSEILIFPSVRGLGCLGCFHTADNSKLLPYIYVQF